MKKTIATLCLLLVIQALQAQPGAGSNTFTQVTDDIYRGSNGFWHSLVYVTPAGLVLVDTINDSYARWLKDELDRRFPDLPVRYVIYSHSHWDHADGGAVFADTAAFVAHEGMWVNMDGRYPHMPGDMIDRNNDGLFEPDEFSIPWDASPGVCGYPWLEEKDSNGDGYLSAQEFFADVVRPNIVYSDTMALQLGGKTIRLVHPGRSHGDDITVVLFEEERTLFSADFLGDALIQDSMHSLPSACGDFDGHALQEWIDSYRRVEQLDFDILTTGHGRPLHFDRETVTDTREYFEYLVSEVSSALAAGMNLEQMKQQLRLERYSDWDQYERLRENNIEAAYKNLTRYSSGDLDHQ